MFAKLSSLFTIFKNFEKIKAFAQTSYEAIDKTLVVLLTIEEQINDTKLGVVLKKYLPEVISVLTKIKDAFEKYGHYVGVVPVGVVQSLQSAFGTPVGDIASAELTTISNKLDVILK